MRFGLFALFFAQGLATDQVNAPGQIVSQAQQRIVASVVCELIARHAVTKQINQNIFEVVFHPHFGTVKLPYFPGKARIILRGLLQTGPRQVGNH